MSWKILLLLIILYFVILVLGGLAFHYLESDDIANADADAANLAQQSRLKIKELMSWEECPDEAGLEDVIVEVLRLYEEGNFSLSNTSTTSKLQWDIPNSMFFAATIATTIGYGHMAPVTQYGRAFCVFYAFVSIPLCLVMLGGVGHTITQLFNKLDKKMDKCKNPKAEKITKSLRSLTTLIIGMGLFMFLPAGAFMYMEEWTYPDSLYFVFITLTTVGLGDLVAGTGLYENEESRTSYQLSVALWIIFGLAWLSTVIAMAQDFFQTLVDKVDDVVIQQMRPHLQLLMDRVDDRVLSQMKLPNIGDIGDRLRRASNTMDADDPNAEALKQALPQYLSPEFLPPQDYQQANSDSLPPINIPVPPPPVSSSDRPVVCSSPQSPPAEEDGIWERRQPPVLGLKPLPDPKTKSKDKSKSKSKAKLKQNKVGHNQQNGDVV